MPDLSSLGSVVFWGIFYVSSRFFGSILFIYAW